MRTGFGGCMAGADVPAGRALALAVPFLLLSVGCRSERPPAQQPVSNDSLAQQGALLLGAAVEMCNGRDDDGNGEADEAWDCVQGREGECITGCGSHGTRRCSEACTWESCRPPEEQCNGADDDCDGQTDEGFDCPAGFQGYCPLEGEQAGELGAGVCGPDCRWVNR